MVVEISAYNIEDAFKLLKEEHDLPMHDYINLDDKLINVASDNNYEGLGLCFGFRTALIGENKNQIQTVVKNMPAGGTKKWKTVYAIVYDRPDSTQLASEDMPEIKKTAIDNARAISQETGRNTFLIVGKSPDNFSRVEAEINYKPSPGQETGVFKFIW